MASFSHPPLPVMEELSLSLYSPHKTSSLFAAGFADSGIFYNGLRYEVPYIQNKPASNALTVPSLSLRATYSAPQLTTRSIRPFTLIITCYSFAPLADFPLFFAHTLRQILQTQTLAFIYLSRTVCEETSYLLHGRCSKHPSQGTGDGEVHSAQKIFFLVIHT